MKINTAVIRVTGDHTTMELDTEYGRAAIASTALRPATLAVCVPLTVADADFPTEAVTVPGRPTDSRTDLVIEVATQDTVILELARRWSEDADATGPFPIPTDAEADAAQWQLDGERLVRVA